MQNRVFLGTQPNDSGVYERTEKNGIPYVRETPLIAAAPDLLEALEWALKAGEKQDGPIDTETLYCMQAAIAKARGQE